MTNVSAFFEEVSYRISDENVTILTGGSSQFIGTVMLLLAICAATDKRKGPAPAERVPIALFVVLLGVSVSIGAQTGK